MASAWPTGSVGSSASTGAGEPGIVTVASAIANAVFDLTGERIREPPIQRHLRG